MSRRQQVDQEKATLKLQLESTIKSLQDQLDSERRRREDTEHSLVAKIRELEASLSRTLGTVSEVERIRQETERKAEARVWDLKERLDYANTAKRRYVWGV